MTNYKNGSDSETTLSVAIKMADKLKYGSS
jgi:hypothetical protein